ncbi:hypothetical protein CW752_07035 [Chryseobacterium sp. PMSZPI]|nr:hypothetical protein CW752_07035 [Chryseobacterium sp. PMSZPI]
MLPDGTGYVSSILEMKGVTPEMFDWWFTWHQLDPLRYKIWDHYVHYDVAVGKKERETLLSDRIPIHEKNWEVTHLINEDIGMGAADINIKFVSPEEFGFDMSQFKEPNVGTAICAKGFINMVHFVRRTKNGIELRSRFWLSKELNPTNNALRGLNYHALEEYTNLEKILPMLYKEYGPKSK